ncbi:MAG: hypothetical protein NVS4B5_09850 [Vulcanimicrobiaceae bacterium]
MAFVDDEHHGLDRAALLGEELRGRIEDGDRHAMGRERRTLSAAEDADLARRERRVPFERVAPLDGEGDGRDGDGDAQRGIPGGNARDRFERDERLAAAGENLERPATDGVPRVDRFPLPGFERESARR